VVRVGAAVAAEGAQEGEDVLADEVELRSWLLRPQVGPAQVRVRGAATVVALREDAPGIGALGPGAELPGLGFGPGLLLIQALEEEQIGDLLYDLDGVGDAAGPEAVPKLVDLVANLSGEQVEPLVSGGQAETITGGPRGGNEACH